MILGVVKRVNLLYFLEEEFPAVPPPPEEAAEQWTEAQIRAHYSLAGDALQSLNGIESKFRQQC